MNRKIIVFGASGNTGLKICEVLDSMNMEHSAFVRSGSESKVKTKYTAIIKGDVLNKMEVEDGLKGQEFTDIIIALGSRDLKVSNIRSEGTKNIVDVLKENDLKSKIHVISAHGVGESWSQLKWYEKLLSNLFLGKTMKDHGLQENIVVNNAGGFHIIRPVALKNDPPSGNIHIETGGKMPNGGITRSDLAKYLVDSMISNENGTHSICKA